jgi:hypothetical protein
MTSRLDELTKGLAVRVYVLKDLETGGTPASEALGQSVNVRVSEVAQALGRRLDQAFAGVVEHHRNGPARQPHGRLELDPVERELGREERVTGRERGFVAEVEDRDLSSPP